MNTIWLITFDKVDYDEYFGCVVIAKDLEEAYIVAGITKEKGLYNNKYLDNVESIKEIGKTLLLRELVLDSFNAG
jgi:hypothetical protein